MKVDDYRLLLMLQKEKTIRGAAERLFISQPAVSQRLKTIEDQWGDALFIRTHKHLILTPVGEKILSFAKEVVKQEEALHDSISSLSEEVTGTLSLGVSSMVGQYLLPSILQKYVEEYPDVTIELETGLSNVLVKGDYHVTIIRGEGIHDKVCESLLADGLYLIDKKMKEIRTPRTLIEFQTDQKYQSTVNDWFISQGAAKPSQVIKVDQIETCKQLMLHGIGMAVLPESSIKDVDDRLYEKVPLIIDGKLLVRQTWLCYAEAAKQLPQVQAFISMVQQHLLTR
ncbi:LysR family transcriptional regulator [Aquibacillus koreensis]|uniref:LysR family transcriptional regulator n=1 Tax=Aquibacillus koreensis TaxID=279446 RepID=A0A9X3WRR1_9BACI|nr:LysR family transcriptional regulator [Aquibacillus koreensis]MCT2534917.1 LysR family transcriptional regulator [Aquibacillus koreensis]MDC3422189.1 LysR family transcriptional regulator [Aquibacillus koreensis]